MSQWGFGPTTFLERVAFFTIFCVFPALGVWKFVELTIWFAGNIHWGAQ